MKAVSRVCRAAVLIQLATACTYVWAQPKVLTHVLHPTQYVEEIVLEPIDLDPIVKEDLMPNPNGGPFRFAVCQPVDVTAGSHGLWEQIDDETFVWRLRIHSAGALSLSMGFTRYHMPSSAYMYLYSPDYVQVWGPFTEIDNKDHGQLWTPQIQGSTIIIEVSIALDDVPDIDLHLTSVNHGYRGYEPQLPFLALGEAQSCHLNVACPEGNSWRDQIRSVARYEFASGDYLYMCTGCLVNNTAQDEKPYFLTAFHCLDLNRDRSLSSSEKNASATMVAYWNFESPTCTGTSSANDHSQTGATFRAGDWSSDYALLELDSKPPEHFNVYYAGWNRSSADPSTSVAIHHPRADLKKISFDENPLSKSDLYDYDALGNRIDYGTFFVVNGWDKGTTEQGSSGGPLFDPDKRIVGCLSFGETDCSLLGPVQIGPFYRFWSGGGTRGTRLSDWLDPDNTGVMFLDGKNIPRRECEHITIGTGTSTWDYPMHTYYHDSRTQVIYLASEIGRSGAITALALDVTRIPEQTMNNWKIRMKHTTMSENTCWLDAGLTVVYENNEAIHSTGWHTFKFQTPFEYNGTDNLLVDFSHNNSHFTSNGECRSSRPGGLRSAYARSDSEYGDPLSWDDPFVLAMQPTVSCGNKIPNVKLTICEGEAKLTASDGAAEERFGDSVSISGDYAIVGAPRDDDNGDRSGSAYIFKYNGGSWIQQTKLTASDGEAYDWFGWSVSMSGDYAIVGAPYDDDNGGASGSAYIFKRSGSSWTQQAKLTASDGATGDVFGLSVSISRDYAVVGAHLDGDNSTDSGSAYIFKRVGTIWSEQAKLTASDGAAEDWFGCSVSISGDYAIVGAVWDDDNGYHSGSAYIFKRSGSSWTQQAKLTAPDGAAEDLFATAVSISGDYAIVGASYDDDNGINSGSAYIFKRNGTSWLEQAKLIPPDSIDSSYHFGNSVSISGDYAIIGARYGYKYVSELNHARDGGSAYIFKRSGASWIQEAKLRASDGASHDYFGSSVSISGDYAIVGAPYDDDNGSASGSVYVYRTAE